jgi:transcriptional regulator with XRE-family HTH domain
MGRHTHGHFELHQPLRAMLGVRIRELRERAHLSLEALSTASGIPLDTLAVIESGAIRQIEAPSLMRIADSLKLKDSYDYLNLMHINKHQLRFKAYNVGLARTGTVTITKMFHNYRAAHEWQFFQILSTIDRYLTNVISREEFKRIIKRRDVIMMREMDSACYNHYFLDVLLDEYPSAKLLFLIRDCYSWLDSVFNTLPAWLPKDPGISAPLVQTELVFGIRSFVTWDIDEFRRNLSRHVDEALSFWGFHNARILKILPHDRSLVIRTHEIVRRVEEIAALVGIPSNSLAGAKRANRSATKLRLLQEIDGDYLERKVKEHCGVVMEEWFPAFTLERFLAGQDP